MGSQHTLKADDGHRFQLYRAEPEGPSRGTVVVVQEIFGVNDHIRDVADRIAGEGYTALAPAFFDRIERNVETGYGEADLARAKALMQQVSFDDAIRDLRATLASPLATGPAAVIGFCWGGTLAWLAATRLPGLACSASYYGRLAIDYRNEQPHCPVLFHFGEQDATIPPEAVAAMREAQPQQTFCLYPADHGFNCDQRASFDAASAALAWQRTRDFLRQYMV